MKIDIEKKVDEILVVILREKVNQYFVEKPKARNLVKIAKDPGAALQRVGDEVADVEKQLRPQTKMGLEKVKMAISQGARSSSSISEYSGVPKGTLTAYLRMLVESEDIEKVDGAGWMLKKD